MVKHIRVSKLHCIAKKKRVDLSDIFLFCGGSDLYSTKSLSLIHPEPLLFPAVHTEPVLHMHFLPTNRCLPATAPTSPNACTVPARIEGERHNSLHLS